MLQILGLGQGEPPVLAARDHVTHVEVVGHDPGPVEQGEAQVEQGGRAVVDPAQQHALVAHVADAGVEHGPGGPGDQRGHRLGRVDVGVDGDVHPALAGPGPEPFHARPHVVGQPVLRQAHERLGGQADVTDAVHLQQGADERLQPGPGQVGHIPAGHDHVPHSGRGPQVVDHGGEPLGRGQPELELARRRGGVADQVHPGAVAAVLRAGGQHLGEHLGRVPVGQPFHRPHLRLVQ